jgi:hypothetical protein
MILFEPWPRWHWQQIVADVIATVANCRWCHCNGGKLQLVSLQQWQMIVASVIATVTAGVITTVAKNCR